MDLLALVILSLWIMLPAYIPNNAAAIFGGGTPLDLGLSWRGNRILGDGKTIRGTISGIACGVITAFILNIINLSVSSLDLPVFSSLVIIALPIGSISGDALGSFLKRSLDIPQGTAAPLLDQLDFVIGSLLLVLFISPTWFFETFTLSIILTIFILTPFLHFSINIIGYLFGIKKVPW